MLLIRIISSHDSVLSILVYTTFGLSVPQDHLNLIRKTRTPPGNRDNDLNKMYLSLMRESKNKKPLRYNLKGFISVGDTGFEPVTPCL